MAQESETAVESVQPEIKLDSSAPASKKRASLQRMYFVRLPKPADVSLDDLEKEKDEIDAKLRQIGLKLAPLMEDRSRVSQNLTDARDSAAEIKAQIDDLELFVNPNKAEKKAAAEERAAKQQERSDRQKATQLEREVRYAKEAAERQKKKNDFSSAYGHLGATTDEEVDARISELEFRQGHETLTINEENTIIKQLKQLQDSRQAIREHARWLEQEKADREFRVQEKKRKSEPTPTEEPVANGVAGNHEDSDKDEEKELEAKKREVMLQMKKELDELWLKYKNLLGEKNQLGDSDKALKGSIDELFTERNALRETRDEVWNKLQKHRSEMRNASKPYSQNRAFSTKVRDLIKKGQVEEAQALCNEQIAEAMKQYKSDAVYRKEYNEVWDAQVDYKRPLAMYQPDSFQSTAASVIAEALETAKKKIASSKAQGGSSQKENGLNPPAEPKQDVAEPAAPSSTTYVPSRQSTIPGMEQEIVRPKPKKAKKSKAALVELPVLDQTEFVPPTSAIKSDAKVLSEAERREQEKEHNRVAQAEAAQRKERRKQAQEKKKLQKAQRAEQQLTKKPASDVASEDTAGPDTPPVQEVNLQNGDSHIAEELASAVNSDNGKLKNRSNDTKQDNKQLNRLAAQKARAQKKKQTWTASAQRYGRSLWLKAQDQPAIAAAFVVVLLAVVLAPVLYMIY